MNKEIIMKKLEELELKLGCYDERMEQLTKKSMKEVLNNIDFGSTDVFIRQRRCLLVVEISTVDIDEVTEIDFHVRGALEYFRLYGNLEDCFESGDISEAEYEVLKEAL